MLRECRERFPRHRLQRKPLVRDPGRHHGTRTMIWVRGYLTNCLCCFFFKLTTAVPSFWISLLYLISDVTTGLCWYPFGSLHASIRLDTFLCLESWCLIYRTKFNYHNFNIINIQIPITFKIIVRPLRILYHHYLEFKDDFKFLSNMNLMHYITN